MLIISSSAKTLDFETPYAAKAATASPVFLEDAEKIQSVLKDMDLQVLKNLLKVNEKLAILNFERMQTWEPSGGRPAIFAYKGDVFRQLTPSEYSEEESEYAKQSLYVMSGLYGPVGAYDVIQPYRLEMAAKVSGVSRGGAMSDFWREKITEHFNTLIERDGHTVLLDLASKEYSAAVDFEKLNCPVVKVDFKEHKNGKLKIMGIFSKRARGMMIDYCIRHRVTSAEEIKKFNGGGYEFHEEEDGRYVFVR